MDDRDCTSFRESSRSFSGRSIGDEGSGFDLALMKRRGFDLICSLDLNPTIAIKSEVYRSRTIWTVIMVDRTVAINSLKASLSTCMIFDRVDRESTRSTRAINRPADPTIHDVPRGLKSK